VKAAEAAGMPEAAAISVEAAYECSNKDPALLERVATYYQMAKNWSKARDAYQKLAELKPGDQDYAFVSQRRKQHLSRIMVFHLVKELVERAGIKKTVSPHTFRHSFATSLLEGGANLRAIQAMLGHESISTTEIYMHIDTTHLREELLTHHPRYAQHSI